MPVPTAAAQMCLRSKSASQNSNKEGRTSLDGRSCRQPQSEKHPAASGRKALKSDGRSQRVSAGRQHRSKQFKRTRNHGWRKLLNNMRTKKKRKQRNPKVIAVFLCLMLVFIAELLFYTWCRVQSVRTKYEITAQRSQVRQLAAMQDNLKIELARLKSPSRIATIAKTQLGLITPTAKQMILLP